MTVFLIGHRGTGKTSLLDALVGLNEGLEGRDLDAEIELRRGDSIARIIQAEGLAAFRALERETLSALVQKDGLDIVALGAGCDADLLDRVECVWIRRDTDEDGRIFLDRPRLDPTVDPLLEFGNRFSEREERYARLAHRIVTLPEGLDLSRSDRGKEHIRLVRDYVLGRLTEVRALITLLPEQAAPSTRLQQTVAHLLSIGADVELRDDLLDDETIRSVFKQGPPERLLYSARRPGAPIPSEVQRLDWDIALGQAPERTTILSCHPSGDCTSDRIVRYGDRLTAFGASHPGAHLKLAPTVGSFDALRAGHDWARGVPRGHTFLPISRDGRWTWYRLLGKGRAGIQYLREGRGSAPDQPTVLQWRLASDGGSTGDGAQFAAFLGDPARHSRTPVEHRDFFAARGQSVVAIRLSEDEWSDAMPMLEELGMTAAAVSAPVKRCALEWCDRLGAQAKRLASVNTLRLRRGVWWGDSTDGQGLKQALAALPLDPSEARVAVWGGGGLSGALRDAIPGASFYSARTGEPRGGPLLLESPDLVVYASGRPGAEVPGHWRPSCVFDLDYRENTPGRAYAVRVGADYVSGLAMFEAQAAAQQELWADEDVGA